jgi:2-polyprenyl-3-methyl-5-hydroxy-6-metoxy-1,4-benzoquinol methylase
MTPGITQCLLCGATEAKAIETIPFSRIWSSLKTDLGAEFQQEVIDRLTPTRDVDLLECQKCRLQFFSPALAGDFEFYSQLTSSVTSYYTEDKWDFSAAAQLIGPGDSVLDIACGGGRFLQLAWELGADVCGIDTNPAAVESAKRKGLPAHCMTLDDFSVENRGCFDVVTAFQVIEHIPEVLPFVRAALDCLRPGGKLLLTVPNRLRRFRDTFEPLDCPPHHLSRWSSDQFRVLARLTGCNVAAIRYEPAGIHDSRALLRRWIGSGQAESLWARMIGRVVFAPALYELYAAAGLLDRWRLWRMSVMAVLERPL